MGNDDFNHFVCVVVGEDPEKVLKPFGPDNNEKKKLVIPISKAPEMRRQFINTYTSIINSPDIGAVEKAFYEDELADVKDMSDIEFFKYKTEEYEHDKETGDAIVYSTKKMWSTCQVGKVFSMPLILKDGSEAYCAKKGDVDWDKVHLTNQEVYKTAWELVMEDRVPETDDEKTIYENMKNRAAYFQKFETKENYVASSTAFWGYAFVSEKDGWEELEPEMGQFEWAKSFYDTFIAPLSDDETITIYECTK